MALLYSSCLEARIFAAWPSAKDAPITFVICPKNIIIRIFLLNPVLRIWDVYPGFEFSVPCPGSKRYQIPDPQQRI
jgi:hypothetical protein